MSAPIIGLTMGDPAGIGPELITAALHHYQGRNIRLVVIGSATGVRPGKLSRLSARRALDALEKSAVLLKKGEINGVVNAPVHKENLVGIGFSYPGQTEFYADRAGLKSGDVTMMMTSRKLSVALVTTHYALADVPRKLTGPAITRTIRRTVAALTGMGIRKPRIAVCGLNPHAGEGGLFGREEKSIIFPALKKARGEFGTRAEISGPWSADTIFISAQKGKYDAVICMYHDQGLIPFKLMNFDSGINLTLGLPFLRASADHGTALDIAGKGTASPSSFFHAIDLVAKLARRKVLA